MIEFIQISLRFLIGVTIGVIIGRFLIGAMNK